MYWDVTGQFTFINMYTYLYTYCQCVCIACIHADTQCVLYMVNNSKTPLCVQSMMQVVLPQIYEGQNMYTASTFSILHIHFISDFEFFILIY